MAGLLERDLYRRIKKMDRTQMESVMREFFDMGAESVTGAGVDMDALRNDICKIKGIGEARLDEIMKVVKKHFDAE